MCKLSKFFNDNFDKYQMMKSKLYNHKVKCVNIVPIQPLITEDFTIHVDKIQINFKTNIISAVKTIDKELIQTNLDIIDDYEEPINYDFAVFEYIKLKFFS